MKKMDRLMNAIRKHDSANVSLLLKEKIDLEEKEVVGGLDGFNYRHQTPLLCALEQMLNNKGNQECEKIVKSLVRAGANVNIRDAVGRYALHYAVKTGNTEIVELLLNNGADKNVKLEDSGRTPVELVLENRDMVFLFNKYGYDFNGSMRYHWGHFNKYNSSTPTPMELAIADNSLKAVENLLDIGVDINKVNLYTPENYKFNDFEDEASERRLNISIKTDNDVFRALLSQGLKVKDEYLYEMLNQLNFSDEKENARKNIETLIEFGADPFKKYENSHNRMVSAIDALWKSDDIKFVELAVAKNRVRQNLEQNKAMTADIKEGMAKTKESGYKHISRTSAPKTSKRGGREE